MKTLFSIGKFDTFKAAHLEKYPKEKAIFDIIEKHFGKFLSFEHDAVIYGGFCRRIIGGESLINADINMIGFYHMRQAGHSEDEMGQFWDFLNRHHVDNARNYLSSYHSASHRVYKIDTLTFTLYEYDSLNMAQVINNADFTCSRLITDLDNVYVYSAQDVDDIKSKVLRLSKDDIRYQWTRKERIKKFTDAGWTLSSEFVATLTEAMRGDSSLLTDVKKPKKKKAYLGNLDLAPAAQPEPAYYVAPPVRNDDIFAVWPDEVPAPQPVEAAPVVGRWVAYGGDGQAPQPAVRRYAYPDYAVRAEIAQQAAQQVANNLQRYQAEAYRREQQAQGNIRGPQQRG